MLYAYERRVYEQCQNGRMAHLRDKLLQPGTRWTADTESVRLGKYFNPTAMPTVYRAPGLPYQTQVWDVALAGTALTHMSRERAARYAKLYNEIALLRDSHAREEELWPRFAPLGFDLTLSMPERTAFLSTLGELARLNQVMAGSGGQFIELASRDGDGMRITRAMIDSVFPHPGHCAQAVPIPLARE